VKSSPPCSVVPEKFVTALSVEDESIDDLRSFSSSLNCSRRRDAGIEAVESDCGRDDRGACLCRIDGVGRNGRAGREVSTLTTVAACERRVVLSMLIRPEYIELTPSKSAPIPAMSVEIRR
jgi:hypothetical protein